MACIEKYRGSKEKKYSAAGLQQIITRNMYRQLAQRHSEFLLMYTRLQLE